MSKNPEQPAQKQTLAHWVSLGLKRALTVNNIMSGFKKTGIFPLDRTAMGSQLGPSSTYQQSGNESLETMLSANPVHVDDNEVDERGHMDLEDAPALGLHDIEDDLDTTPDATTEHFFVHATASELKFSEDIGGLEPNCTNPQSITSFLSLPTITQRSNPRRCTSDPIVNFSKSILLTSEDYMNSVQQMQAQNVERERQKQTAHIERAEAKRRKVEEQEERRVRREAHQRQMAEERARKLQE